MNRLADEIGKYYVEKGMNTKGVHRYYMEYGVLPNIFTCGVNNEDKMYRTLESLGGSWEDKLVKMKEWRDMQKNLYLQ
jgi:hypothetical protein